VLQVPGGTGVRDSTRTSGHTGNDSTEKNNNKSWAKRFSLRRLANPSTASGGALKKPPVSAGHHLVNSVDETGMVEALHVAYLPEVTGTESNERTGWISEPESLSM